MMADGATQATDVLGERVERAIKLGLGNLARSQNELGSWSGDYGGPMFLLPMYIALCHISKQTIPTRQRDGMVEYFFNVQNDDGSIGLHCEGTGCMFTSALSYTALRLLDVDREDPRMARMRQWIQRSGTALGASSWGKFTLALLNVYDYEGLNPILPELWLLPRQLSVHPGRLWCHCRQVYLPMAYLYGIRAQIPADDLIRSIRADLYDQPYESIKFAKHRETIAPMDNYAPMSALMRVSNRTMLSYEKRHSTRLRRRALDEILDHIDYEDRVTNDIDIGPVNAVLNTVCHHFRPNGEGSFERGFAQLQQYLWDGHDGTKMQGYNSSQLWDTGFTIQAMLATPFWEEHSDTMRRAHDFVRDNQILEDVPDHEHYHRHPCRGGWPFSNRAHGWPITDCTSEGLKCALALENWADNPVPEELLEAATRVLLTYQNTDGGWATYELTRGPKWLEMLNPSGVFSDIMIDYSYTECTSACLQALLKGKERFPGKLDDEIDQAVARAVAFLRDKQRDDGSWEGSWAVCFTYGTWFGVHGLLAAGVPPSDPAIRKACAFLLDKQRADGAWAEHHTSCSERRYVDGPEGHAVNTSWALLTLIGAGETDHAAIDRGIEFLLGRQVEDGGWPRESIVGVFNKTSMITYDNYRHYFPVWAMGEWMRSRA